ncbi:MAG: tripartite tricarboxylate transporter TctB family protein [Synergistota bacterium]|nr:tripartite tricarboxylate transporter TctB family protein [Synergistota bacterium]
MLFLAFVFLLLSFGVEEIEAVGSSARIAPRLWAAGLALFTLDQLWRIFQGNAPEDPATGDVKRVLLTACIVALSLWGMNTAGYLVSSSGMILLLLLLFGERRIPVLLALSGGWAAFSWYVFVRLLHISLPSGILFG